MTLIAFATYGSDRAEFITDSASYTLRVSSMGRSTKHLTINHLDAAVLTQGDSNFGNTVKSSSLMAADELGSFDTMVDTAPDWLGHLWQLCIADKSTPADSQSTIFLLGWSDRASKFVAWAFASEHEFQPIKVPGLWVMPCPWMMRPSKLELERMQGWMHEHRDVDQAAQVWAARPPRPAPRTQREWIDLAVEARTQRSLSGGFAHVIVAGEVFHTVLRRGSVRTDRVHQFNDSGDEFLTLIKHTEHPVALAGPCHCDSGKTYGDCCAGQYPCGCRSGKPFGECCMLSREEVPTRS